MAGAELRHRRGFSGSCPSRSAMLRFLRGSALMADGAVLSWVSNDNPGYPYPEAAGFVLALLSIETGTTGPIENGIARWIARHVSKDGGVGREGDDYVFDTAMAYRGLVACRDRGGAVAPSSLGAMRRFVSAGIAERRATGVAIQASSGRWSTRFSCHLLKTAQVVRREDHAWDELLDLYDSGRFRIHANSEKSYLHASCYAAEGLMTLIDGGSSEAERMLGGCAEWLARIQAGDGGIAAWHDGRQPTGPVHTDVVAQAIRIWVRVDAEHYRDPIGRALEYLADRQDSSGGIPYRDGSKDINTWATVFAAQAVEWAERGRPHGSLI